MAFTGLGILFLPVPLTIFRALLRPLFPTLLPGTLMILALPLFLGPAVLVLGTGLFIAFFFSGRLFPFGPAPLTLTSGRAGRPAAGS